MTCIMTREKKTLGSHFKTCGPVGLGLCNLFVILLLFNRALC
jgi:hypothetical protein